MPIIFRVCIIKSLGIKLKKKNLNRTPKPSTSEMRFTSFVLVNVDFTAFIGSARCPGPPSASAALVGVPRSHAPGAEGPSSFFTAPPPSSGRFAIQPGGTGSRSPCPSSSGYSHVPPRTRSFPAPRDVVHRNSERLPALPSDAERGSTSASPARPAWEQSAAAAACRCRF